MIILVTFESAYFVVNSVIVFTAFVPDGKQNT